MRESSELNESWIQTWMNWELNKPCWHWSGGSELKDFWQQWFAVETDPIMEWSTWHY